MKPTDIIVPAMCASCGGTFYKPRDAVLLIQCRDCYLADQQRADDIVEAFEDDDEG